MNEETQLWESFEINTLALGAVHVIPLRLVGRDAIRSVNLQNPQLFQSRVHRLAEVLDEETILLARAQEKDARATRLVCIERLGGTLFSLSNSLSTLSTYPGTCSVSKIMNKSSMNFNAPSVNQKDWWTAYIKLAPNPAPISLPDYQLDLGAQPGLPVAQEPEFRDTLQRIVSELRSSYYDFLYLSRASLVFFAKATLPDFQRRVLKHSFAREEYAIYILRELVPPLATLDNRYKTVLPALVHQAERGDSKPETTLTSCESPVFSLWLTSMFSKADSSHELNKTEALLILKTREYQLLILLLLEILAIAKETGMNSDFTLTTAADAAPQPHAPLVLVDVLIDRLGIYQSLNLAKNEDPLRMFCLEVINPFYSSRLPDLTAALTQKCLPQDLISPQIPTTPGRSLKNKMYGTTGIATGSRVAALKRTRSAPADLLAEKKVDYKKRKLGREISMSKRLPNPEQPKPRPISVNKSTNNSFEQKRKTKLALAEKESIQVEQTPAKSRHRNMINLVEKTSAPQITIAKHSKANFMSIIETPVKSAGEARDNIDDLPDAVYQTPIECSAQVSRAPVDGVQDSPSGRSIFFRLETPLLPQQSTSPRRSKDKVVPLRSAGKAPSLRKSVTFSTFSTSKHESTSASAFHNSLMDESEDEVSGKKQNNLFGKEIARRKSVSGGAASIETQRSITANEPADSVPAQTLEAELDWL